MKVAQRPPRTARNFFCVIISIEPMERFRGTRGHVTDQLNELEGLGTWITPTKQACSLVPRPGNETSKRGADSSNSKAYGEKKLPRKVGRLKPPQPPRFRRPCTLSLLSVLPPLSLLRQ